MPTENSYKAGVLNLLVAHGEIDEITHMAVSAYMEKQNRCSLRTLLETHLYSETQLADKIGQYLKVSRMIDLKLEQIDTDFFKKIPFPLAKKNMVIALGYDELSPERIVLVMADPTREDIIQEIKQILGGPLTLAVAERSEIKRLINNAYPLELQLPTLFSI